MKKFYTNVVLFAIIFLVAVILFDYLSMVGITKWLIADLTNSRDFITGNVGSDDIKPVIARVQLQDETTKLIIGDSVCKQMFEGLQEYNDDFTIAGSNGAITMAGQYILAREYIENHPDATDIFLIVLPESLGRTFDTVWGYQYAVMPFVETDTLKLLDDDTLRILELVYGKFFITPSVVKAIDLSGMNRKLYLNILRDHFEGYILENHFELADRYVYKIYELCKNKGINFHLYACPVSEVKLEYIYNLKEQFKDSRIYEINPEFMESIYYYPAEQAADGTHFNGEYANQECYNEKIRQIFANQDLLSLLKLEKNP